MGTLLKKTRKGTTLIEMVIVLGVVASISTIFMTYQSIDTRHEEDWAKFERKFDQLYLKYREKNATFFITFGKSVRLGESVIDLPPNWVPTVMNRSIEIGPLYVAPNSYVFQNVKTLDRKEIVFQLGGGTYDFR